MKRELSPARLFRRSAEWSWQIKALCSGRSGRHSIEIQPKLLRALQEREFERLGSTHTRRANIRLVAATNRDLEQMIAAREFRSDLYYRLHVFPIRVPPLRERKEDIPQLVSYFVQKFAKQMQKKIEAISPAVMKGLTAWDCQATFASWRISSSGR